MLGLIFSLLLVVSSAEESSVFQYTGFSQGQMGVGAVLGVPAGVRVQRFLSWRANVFLTAGYGIDRFIMADVNYSYYVYAQEDPWQGSTKVGHILYNIFAGATTGFPLKSDDRSRMGLRGGAAFEYLLPNSRWTLRAEVAPVIYLSGSTAAGFQSGILAMYYFGQNSKAPLKKTFEDTNPKR